MTSIYMIDVIIDVYDATSPAATYIYRRPGINHVSSSSSKTTHSWDFRGHQVKETVVHQATSDPNFKAYRAGNDSDTAQEHRLAMFRAWKQEFDIQTLDEAMAFSNWQKNMEHIFEVNSDPDIKHWVGANKFAAMSMAELKALKYNPERSRALSAHSQGLPEFADTLLAAHGGAENNHKRNRKSKKHGNGGHIAPSPHGLASPPAGSKPPHRVVVGSTQTTGITVDWVAAGAVTPVCVCIRGLLSQCPGKSNLLHWVHQQALALPATWGGLGHHTYYLVS